MKFVLFLITILIKKTVQLQNPDQISLVYYHGRSGSDDYKSYPLNNLTTLVLYGNYDKINLNLNTYKNRGVKHVHYLIGDSYGLFGFPETDAHRSRMLDKFQFKNSTYRTEKIEFWLDFVVQNNFTGINLDFENSLFRAEDRRGLTEFVREICEKFRNWNVQVSFAVPYHPHTLNCITGRCYDWLAISKHVDYFVVMGYDTQTNPFVADSTCDGVQVHKGLKKYLSIGVPHSKLVIGLPWYFPVTKCVFRLFNVCFSWIISQNYKTQVCQSGLETKYEKVSKSAKFDDKSGSYYFDVSSDYKDGLSWKPSSKQIFFDNSTSLNAKITKFQELGSFRGIASWRAGCSNTVDSNVQEYSDFDGIWNTLRPNNSDTNGTDLVGNCEIYCSVQDYEMTFCLILLLIVVLAFHFEFKLRCLRNRVNQVLRKKRQRVTYSELADYETESLVGYDSSSSDSVFSI